MGGGGGWVYVRRDGDGKTWWKHDPVYCTILTSLASQSNLCMCMEVDNRYGGGGGGGGARGGGGGGNICLFFGEMGFKFKC